MQMAPADRAQQCAHLKALPKDMMSNLSACSEELRQTLTMAKQVCASDSGTAEDAYADIGARSRTLALPWGNDMWCQNVSKLQIWSWMYVSCVVTYGCLNACRR